MALLGALVVAYVAAAPSLRGVAARAVASVYTRIATPGVLARSTASPVALHVTSRDQPPRALAIPFGRIWLIVTVALAAGGVPGRGVATITWTALGISAVELGAAAAAVAGASAMWHLVDAARLVDLPLLVGVALWLWNTHHTSQPERRPQTRPHSTG